MTRCLAILWVWPLVGQPVNWRPGPEKVLLGDGLDLRVPPGLVYATGGEAKRFLERTGNPPAGNERVVAGPPDLGWFAVFAQEEYEALGWARPAGGQPDIAAIRAAIERGSEAANRERARRGRETLSVLRFREAPSWDAERGRVEWSLETRESGGRMVINHFAYIPASDYVIAAELVSERQRAEGLTEFHLLLDGVVRRVESARLPDHPASRSDRQKWAPLLVAACVGAVILLWRRASRR